MHNWEVQLQVKVHGKGKDLFGDGMVFWYSRDRMIPGPIFGSKDYFMGLAVFIDTYSNHNGPHNHQHPYVSAMVNLTLLPVSPPVFKRLEHEILDVDFCI